MYTCTLVAMQHCVHPGKICVSRLTAHSQQNCSWIPVDTLASSILNLATTASKSSGLAVYNLSSPRLFHWARDLLPLLFRIRTAPTFNAVDSSVWLAALRNYNKEADNTEASESNRAVRRNPAVKLLEYFEGMYGVADGSGIEGGGRQEQGKGEIIFSTEVAEKESRGLREAPDVLDAGLLGKFVHEWMRKWDVEDKEQ